MPKASPIQPSFAGGEFSPKVHGRVDNERYKTGLAKSLNYLPTVQGPLLRRPGTKYSGSDAKDPSKPPAFIPFQFSQTQNYILEFGDKYIRFFTNNERLVTNSTHFLVSGTHGFGSANVVYNSSNFYAMRSTAIPNPGESILTSSVIVASTILEIESPYVYPDAANIKVAQKEDTLFLVNTSYPTFKLQRMSHTQWDLKRVNFSDGPYLPINSYRQTFDTERFGFTTAGAPLFIYPQDDSTDWDITTGPTKAVASVTYPGGSSGPVRVTTIGDHPYLTGDKVVILSVAGATGVNNNSSSISALYWQITRVSGTAFDLNGTTFMSTYSSGGMVYPALFEPISTTSQFNDQLRNIAFVRADGGKAFGVINSITDMARATVHVSAESPSITAGSGNFVSTWQLGTYCVKNGYPSAITFHQSRLALAGVPQYPQRLDLSNTDEYENFATVGSSNANPTDSNAMSFTLASDQINRIHWMKSDTQGLLAGSLSSEWNITPSNQGAALTPTNFNAKQTSFFGSHDADAVQTGNATLYIQKAQRRVRELNYFYQVDTYRSTDIAELSDHLMLPGLTKLVNQKESIPIVWALTTEGKIRSMTYSRDDAALKVGWAPHQLGGQSDSSGTAPVIKTMAVIPSPDGTFDQLWCAVQRYVNGTSVLNIEYMTKVFDDETAIEDSTCLDLSGKYDSPITITGITQAGSAIVTAASHGLVDGDEIKISEVIGLNSSYVDVNEVTFNSNLVNGHLFRVGSTSANAFFLQDINNGSSYIDSRTYTPYFSSGEARKLVSTISGLTWLKNESVDVLADGKVHPVTTVNSAGVLALQFKAAVVNIGYAYNSDGKTLRPEAGAADGTSIGKLRRPARAAILLHKTGELAIGPSFDRLTPMKFETFDPPQADVATPLFSGIARESLESEHDFEGQLCFRMSSPLPGMVQSITVMLEEQDV